MRLVGHTWASRRTNQCAPLYRPWLPLPALGRINTPSADEWSQRRLWRELPLVQMCTAHLEYYDKEHPGRTGLLKSREWKQASQISRGTLQGQDNTSTYADMSLFRDIECGPVPNITGHAWLLSAPRIRGTFTLVWTCVSVVLLCTWAILYSNVPIETEERTCEQRWRRRGYLLSRAVFWWLIALVAPELVACAEVSKFLAAKYLVETVKAKVDAEKAEVKEKGAATGRNTPAVCHETNPRRWAIWDLQHAFLANMGGFAIKFPAEKTKPGNAPATATGPATSNGAESSDLQGAGAPSDRLCAKCKQPLAEETKDDHDNIKAPLTNVTTVEVGPDRSSAEKDKNCTANGTATKHPLGARYGRPISEQKDSDKLAFLFPLESLGKTLWSCGNNGSNARLVEAVLKSETPERLGETHHSPTSFFDNVMALRGDIWVLEGPQLLKAVELGIINLPTVRPAEIQDKGKADQITTALALGQAGWFALELALRAARRLPTSQLETYTLGFVVCSIITYIMVWNKPKSVSTRIQITALRRPANADEIREVAIQAGIPQWFRRNAHSIGDDVVHDCGHKWLDYFKVGPSLPLHISGCVIALVFGAVHFTAWNAKFPYPLEQKLWHWACILLTALPLPISGFMLCAQHLRLTSVSAPAGTDGGECGGTPPQVRRKRTKLMKWIVRLLWVIVILMYTLYVGARFFIVIEAVRSLFFLPPGAYTTTAIWDFPHIG